MVLVSGGQTGVDRAALDIAIKLNIPYMGWCPKDRWAEDGRIDPKYKLKECESVEPEERTRLNIDDSQAALILTKFGYLDQGTGLAVDHLKKTAKPYFIADPGSEDNLDQVRDWLENQEIGVLNIAGPRESNLPGIYDLSYQFLLTLFEGKRLFPFFI